MKAVDDQPVWSVICFCCAGRVPQPTLTHATDVVADREVRARGAPRSRRDLAEAVDAGAAVAAVPLHRREGRGAAAGAIFALLRRLRGAPAAPGARFDTLDWLVLLTVLAGLALAFFGVLVSGATHVRDIWLLPLLYLAFRWRRCGCSSASPRGAPNSAPDDCGVGYPRDGVARRPHPLRRAGPSAAQPLPLKSLRWQARHPRLPRGGIHQAGAHLRRITHRDQGHS